MLAKSLGSQVILYANPKSANLTVSLLKTSMFSSLISLCAIYCECKYSKALPIYLKYWIIDLKGRCESPKGLNSEPLHILKRSQNALSIFKEQHWTGVPLTVILLLGTKAYGFIMCGWLSFWRICHSLVRSSHSR